MRKIHSNSSSPGNGMDVGDNLEETPVYIPRAPYAQTSHKMNQPTSYTEPHLVKQDELTPGITRKEYELRRDKLFRKMPHQSVILLPCNPVAKFSHDGTYRFRQDSTFNYFTGLQETNCLALLTKDAAANCQYILFVTPRSTNDETTWNGHRCGLDGAKKYFGAHRSFNFERDRKALTDILESFGKVYIDQSVNLELADTITCWIKDCKKKVKLLKPLTKVIQQIRVYKSPAEIRLMRQSAKISALSMIDTMQFCEPGMLESELMHRFEYSCKQRGADRMSFNCSVASGGNAVDLCYFNNNDELQDQDLVLIDCGGEYNGYASDITRTFPVNGRFTPIQRQLYEMVLNASTELIKAMKPGCTIKKLEDMSKRLLQNGLKKLGVFERLKNQHIKDLKLTSANVHYVTHFIGLDIHDTSGLSQTLSFEPGMVLAIEPAIYIREHPLINPKFWNIGIRVEDDVLITAGDAEILSSALPRTVEDIEQIMREKSIFPRIRRITDYEEESKAFEDDVVMQGVREINGVIDLINSPEGRSGSGEQQQYDAAEIEAARTLSSLRLAAKEKEKTQRRAQSQQLQWLKLIQQAIHEQDEYSPRSNHSKKGNRKLQHSLTPDTGMRITRSGRCYADTSKITQDCSESDSAVHDDKQQQPSTPRSSQSASKPEPTKQPKVRRQQQIQRSKPKTKKKSLGRIPKLSKSKSNGSSTKSKSKSKSATTASNGDAVSTPTAAAPNANHAVSASANIDGDSHSHSTSLRTRRTNGGSTSSGVCHSAKKWSATKSDAGNSLHCRSNRTSKKTQSKRATNGKDDSAVTKPATPWSIAARDASAARNGRVAKRDLRRQRKPISNVGAQPDDATKLCPKRSQSPAVRGTKRSDDAKRAVNAKPASADDPGHSATATPFAAKSGITKSSKLSKCSKSQSSHKVNASSGIPRYDTDDTATTVSEDHVMRSSRRKKSLFASSRGNKKLRTSNSPALCGQKRKRDGSERIGRQSADRSRSCSSRRALNDSKKSKNQKSGDRGAIDLYHHRHGREHDNVLLVQPPSKKGRFSPGHSGAPHHHMTSKGRSYSNSRQFGRYHMNPSHPPHPTFSPGGRMRSNYYGPDCGEERVSERLPTPNGGYPIPNGYPYVHGPRAHGHVHGGNPSHHSNHYYMSQVLYVPYNMVYQDTSGHLNSSSTSPSNEEESAYDCFMAKSNDKHTDKQ